MKSWKRKKYEDALQLWFAQWIVAALRVFFRLWAHLGPEERRRKLREFNAQMDAMDHERKTMLPVEAQTYPGATSFAANVWLRRIDIGLLALCTGIDLQSIAWLTCFTALGESATATAAGGFLLGILTLFLGIVWFIVLRSGKKAWSRPCLSLLGVCWLAILGAVFLMPDTYWPMRLIFALQRTQFEQLAQRIERGDVPTKPVRVGFYTVTLAERDSNGVVCFWIGSDGAPRGIGFGKCKATEVPRSFHNLNFQITLADDWQFVEQD